MSIDHDIDWASIIYRGIESEELDYKAAQDWRGLSRHGKAKFARHCMALANTKGGYIVVGVGEDRAGKPSKFTGLTDDQLKGFDPTDIGNFVNRFADPPIDFDIIRPEVDGKTYAVFVVRRFRDLPHVCSHNCDCELQQGAFYIRTADASSRVAYRGSEIHDIVQRALRNQREILSRMLRGILYEKGQKPEPMAESLFNEQLRHAEGFVGRNAGKTFLRQPRLSVHCYPSDFYKSAFDLSEIKEAVVDSSISFHGVPLYEVEDDEATYFTNVSLRSLGLKRGVHFQAFRSGLFHGCHGLPSVDGKIQYEDMLGLVTEIVYFVSNYYSSLGYNDELMTLVMRLEGVDGQVLQMRGRTPKGKQCVCRVPELHVELKRTAVDLVSGVVEHARRFIREVSVRFNIPDGWHPNIERLVEEYLDRRL